MIPLFFMDALLFIIEHFSARFHYIYFNVSLISIRFLFIHFLTPNHKSAKRSIRNLQNNPGKYPGIITSKKFIVLVYYFFDFSFSSSLSLSEGFHTFTSAFLSIPERISTLIPSLAPSFT